MVIGHSSTFYRINLEIHFIRFLSCNLDFSSSLIFLFFFTPKDFKEINQRPRKVCFVQEDRDSIDRDNRSDSAGTRKKHGKLKKKKLYIKETTKKVFFLMQPCD